MLAFKKLDPPLIHAGSKSKTFCGRELTMIEKLQDWVLANEFAGVFKFFNEGPIFPLFYRDCAGLQIIDWNSVEDDENVHAECGAYDVETGELVLGIKILDGKYEEFNFGNYI